MKFLLEVAVAIFLVGILSVPRAMGGSSVNVPLEDWSYEALEKLAGFGLLESDIVGTRPYSRAEVARLVQEALRLKADRGKELSPLAEYLLERFQKEYRDELASLGLGSGNTAKTYIKPVQRLQVGYVYSNGEPRQFVGFPGIQSTADIQATEGTPLVYNNEGVIYGEHNNFTVQVSSTLQYRDIASAYVEPILLARQDKGNFHDYDKVELDLLKGYGKISPWSMELQGGRDSLWWGQGYHGNLLLTNNGTPLDLVKLSNPSPILLPWFLSYLGPFKYNFFLSVLEEDRVVPHPWFAGIRLEIKPSPIFEMGVTTTFMFNGEGRPKLSFLDFLHLLVFQPPSGGGGPNKTNQLGAFDFRLRLPFLRNAEIYAEYGGDDWSGTDSAYLFDDIGYLAGIYIPRLTEDGRAEFRFEYARNAHTIDQTPTFWYGHFVYQSGYTHDGLVMGHHMDGDAEDYFVRTAYYLRNDLKVGLDFDYMERGITLSPTQEENFQWGSDVSFDVSSALTIRARFAYEKVKNFNLQPEDNRQNQLLMTTLIWRF